MLNELKMLLSGNAEENHGKSQQILNEISGYGLF